MRLTIDNLDGAGELDYSAALCAAEPLRVERVLNRPSRCTGALVLAAEINPGSAPALPRPLRRARVRVSNDAGTVLFTGYIATEPAAEFAGAGLAGAAYRLVFTAFSDEWLLDRQRLLLTQQGFATDGSTLLGALAERTAAGVLSHTPGLAHPVGVFSPQTEGGFSANAAAIASASYGAYRALNGRLSLRNVGSTTHAVDLDDPAVGEAVSPAYLEVAAARELANDITVAGELEPAAYVTEMFSGDGTTSEFTLAHAPFRPERTELLSDSFDVAALDPARWSIADPGAHITRGAGGLVLSGGNGFDGQTALTARDPVELAGTLILEADSVELTAPSDGVLTGLYSGAVERENCVAGWDVTQSGGATMVQPLVGGIPTGTSYILAPGHGYTLRTRLHSPETQRVRQVYYARVEGVLNAYGGGPVDSEVLAVFEVVDLGNASNTPATVLYDGAIAATPASCTYAAVNSLSLTGSIGAVRVQQSGSAWITSWVAGVTRSRRSGLPGTGADYQISPTGVLTFFAGRIPAPGETVTVRYRTRSRAVARLNDPASVALEAISGAPGTSRWVGRVVHPPARSTQDCEAAAQALLALGTSRSAALKGRYTAANPTEDIWPGDVLAINDGGEVLNVVARSVSIADGHAAPELLTYKVAFANDWAETLGLQVSESIPPDTVLPGQALAAPPAALDSLTALTVVNATGSALDLDAGTDPPAGGGFEVRRAEGNFAATPGADLVLRSPVRAFTIPRAAFRESFYIRMYDGSTPRIYSRHSAAVITNLPVA